MIRVIVTMAGIYIYVFFPISSITSVFPFLVVFFCSLSSFARCFSPRRRGFAEIYFFFVLFMLRHFWRWKVYFGCTLASRRSQSYHFGHSTQINVWKWRAGWLVSRHSTCCHFGSVRFGMYTQLLRWIINWGQLDGERCVPNGGHVTINNYNHVLCNFCFWSNFWFTHTTSCELA